MDRFEKFDLAYEKSKKEDPGVFDHPFLEKIALENEIENVEKTLKVQLPDEYKYFLSKHPAGYFGTAPIYSVKINSDFYITKINQENPHIGYILFSDNGCGDYYGFKIENGRCSPEVYFYDHEIEMWENTEYENLFDSLYVRSLRLV